MHHLRVTVPITLRTMHVYHTPRPDFSKLGVCPLSIDTRIPCGVRFRKHPSSSCSTMGSFASKPNVSPPAKTTTRQETSQRQPFPVAPPVVRAALHSSQRSCAISEHYPLQGGDVPKREQFQLSSNTQKRHPMSEDVLPVPSARIQTKSASAPSSSRNTNTPSSAGECHCCWSAQLPH